jgi:hypothetical protein
VSWPRPHAACCVRKFCPYPLLHALADFLGERFREGWRTAVKVPEGRRRQGGIAGPTAPPTQQWARKRARTAAAGHHAQQLLRGAQERVPSQQQQRRCGAHEWLLQQHRGQSPCWEDLVEERFLTLIALKSKHFKLVIFWQSSLPDPFCATCHGSGTGSQAC